MFYPIGKPETEYTIPNNVTTIGEYAFIASKKLTKVNFPNSLTSIEKSAFAGSKNAVIKLPASITSIGEAAFVLENHEVGIVYCKKVLVPNNTIKQLVIDSYYPDDPEMLIMYQP